MKLKDINKARRMILSFLFNAKIFTQENVSFKLSEEYLQQILIANYL